jgi:hypothetical protein
MVKELMDNKGKVLDVLESVDLLKDIEEERKQLDAKLTEEVTSCFSLRSGSTKRSSKTREHCCKATLFVSLMF